MPIDRDMLRQIGHMTRPLSTRLSNLIARGPVLLVDDSAGMQLLQVGGLANETIEGSKGVEHFQPYGFSSVPLTAAEHVTIFPNGDRGHPITIAAPDRRYRPTSGQAGEVVMYTDEGDTIRLGRGHVMTLSTSTRLNLGGDSASQAGVLGDALLTALGTLVTAIATAVGTSGTPAGATAAATAITTALTTFQTAASGFLSTKVKLE